MSPNSPYEIIFKPIIVCLLASKETIENEVVYKVKTTHTISSRFQDWHRAVSLVKKVAGKVNLRF